MSQSATKRKRSNDGIHAGVATVRCEWSRTKTCMTLQRASSKGSWSVAHAA